MRNVYDIMCIGKNLKNKACSLYEKVCLNFNHECEFK